MGIPDHLTCLLRNLYAGQMVEGPNNWVQNDGCLWLKWMPKLCQFTGVLLNCAKDADFIKEAIKVIREFEGFSGGVVVRICLPMQETQKPRVPSLCLEDPLMKEMTTQPVFLSGKFHGQRSLADYSLWAHKDRTQLSTHTTWEFEGKWYGQVCML